MEIQKVLCFKIWDIDHENQTFYGLSASLLNAVDRVEFVGKFVDKNIFNEPNWLEMLIKTFLK